MPSGFYPGERLIGYIRVRVPSAVQLLEITKEYMISATITPEEYPQAFGAFLSEEFSRFKEDIIEYGDEPVGNDIWYIDGKIIYLEDGNQEIIRRQEFSISVSILDHYRVVEYWFEDGSHLKYDHLDGRGYVFFYAEEE
jgi:hypothetical protein